MTQTNIFQIKREMADEHRWGKKIQKIQKYRQKYMKLG